MKVWCITRLALEIMCPILITGMKNRYILVVQDYFTKFVEASALPNQEAVTITRKLVDKVICIYGIPKIILTDKGYHFKSQLIHDLCDFHHITPNPTAWWTNLI